MKTRHPRTSTAPGNDPGATAVINHRVREDRHAEYEDWVNEIAPLCRAAPGHLDWHLVRPIPGLTHTYTAIIRFDTIAHLRDWMESSTRANLIGKVRPLLAADDDFHISSGLDFWFTPAGTRARVPVRWKQFLATWSVIFPLVFGIPLLMEQLLQALGAGGHRALTVLLSTGIIVLLMVYVIMPRYTRLLQRWLFR